MAAADDVGDFWSNLSFLAGSLQHFRPLTQQSSDGDLTQQRRSLVVLNLIELHIMHVVEAISNNQQPMLIIPNRTSKTNSKKRIIFDINKPKSAMKFVQFIFILSQIYQLIRTDRICTKRDLFYRNVNLFKKQTVVDEIVDDVACWFRVSRNWLHVVATAKGLVSGDLKFYDGGKGNFVNCADISQGFLIPSDTEHFSSLQSNARFVLIVEKDAIFNKLLGTDLAARLKCILITGKGFPDLNTRQLVAKIWIDLKLPILVLVDGDPYGIEIMCVYRFGSASLQHECHRLIPSHVVRWLGLFPEDVENLNLNSLSDCVSPLTQIDKRFAEKLLERMKNNISISRQIQILLRNNEKVELEALDKLGINYLSNVYLPNKIRFGGWI
uniref:DNA topoisomerase (ATP-hydrolyzing) n=1 Tax=Strigamia maritima TaxID=126957 RepID=T1J6U8_STRMM